MWYFDGLAQGTQDLYWFRQIGALRPVGSVVCSSSDARRRGYKLGRQREASPKSLRLRPSANIVSVCDGLLWLCERESMPFPWPKGPFIVSREPNDLVAMGEEKGENKEKVQAHAQMLV